jgi:hypothetical protein
MFLSVNACFRQVSSQPGCLGVRCPCETSSVLLLNALGRPRCRGLKTTNKEELAAAQALIDTPITAENLQPLVAFSRNKHVSSSWPKLSAMETFAAWNCGDEFPNCLDDAIAALNDSKEKAIPMAETGVRPRSSWITFCFHRRHQVLFSRR